MMPSQSCITSRGFSILELLVVLGLIAVLTGLGMGFLGRGNTDMVVAWTVLRDQVRLAADSAYGSGRPTDLRINQPEDLPVSVQCRILQPVGFWHLEPGEQPFGALLPRLHGESSPAGRFGACMLPDPEARKTLFTLPTNGQSRFDLRDGFSFRLELRLQERQQMVVARLGRAFRIELSAELQPKAVVTLADPGPTPGRNILLQGLDQSLPLDRWFSLELLHDGKELSLLVDGVAWARQEAKGHAYQQAEDELEISPADTPVLGAVDEIQLYAYEMGPPRHLPSGVQVLGLEQGLHFDGLGHWQAQEPNQAWPLIKLILHEQEESKSLAPGGLLQ